MAGTILGFIGLGSMGDPMSARLLDAGYQLCVFDTRPEVMSRVVAMGASPAASALDVASRAKTVLICLPTPDVVRSVVLGDNGLINGSAIETLIDLSTSGPAVAKIVADGLSAKNIAMVDSPISGGPEGAVAGTLAVMVSCSKTTFAAVEPILKVFGRTFFTGEKPGTAQYAKLANNLLAATALVITAEAMAVAVKAGVDARVLIDILNAGSGRNTATSDKFPAGVLPGTYNFGFPTGLINKDVRMCMEQAEILGVPMVVGAAVRQMLTMTKAKYGAESDFACMAKMVEEWAGVEIRG